MMFWLYGNPRATAIVSMNPLINVQAKLQAPSVSEGHEAAFFRISLEHLNALLDLKLVEWEELGEGKEGVKVMEQAIYWLP